jgi:hypothetical protein
MSTADRLTGMAKLVSPFLHLLVVNALKSERLMSVSFLTFLLVEYDKVYTLFAGRFKMHTLFAG